MNKRIQLSKMNIRIQTSEIPLSWFVGIYSELGLFTLELHQASPNAVDFQWKEALKSLELLQKRSSYINQCATTQRSAFFVLM